MRCKLRDGKIDHVACLGKKIHKHVALEDFLRLPEAKLDYDRFAFVRNPYDRIYSGYMQRKHRLIEREDFGELDPIEINREIDSINNGFHKFLEYAIGRNKRMGSYSLNSDVNTTPQLAILPTNHGRGKMSIELSKFDPPAQERRSRNARRTVSAKEVLNPRQYRAIRFFRDQEG